MQTTHLNPSRWMLMATLAAVLMIGGCDQNDKTAKNGNGDTGTPNGDKVALPDGLFLDTKPTDKATPVKDIKQSAKEGDEVVMRVVVGGREEPFVSQRAIMTVVSAEMKNQCKLPGDHCETPWDYCCEAPAELKANMATIQIVDADGLPLKIDLSDDARIKPASVVTVVGKVGPRPDREALVVTATGLYVEPATP